jgi:hypothetical protein
MAALPPAAHRDEVSNDTRAADVLQSGESSLIEGTSQGRIVGYTLIDDCVVASLAQPAGSRKGASDPSSPLNRHRSILRSTLRR